MDGGRALDGAERETEEEVRERFPGGGLQQLVLLQYGDDSETEPPGGGLQRLVLLQYGDDSETEPGELRACQHFDKAR